MAKGLTPEEREDRDRKAAAKIKAKRSIRDELPEAFVVSIADSFEVEGASVLRTMLKERPDLAYEVISKVLRPEDMKRVRALGNEVNDDVLREIARRAAEGVRKGTVAEGKPALSRLN